MSTNTDLSVNLNKVALLRNSRQGNYPNPVDYARICIDAGCNGITVHPRPDQRHISPADVKNLSAVCAQHSDIEFNIEGNPFAGEAGDYPGFMQLVEQQRPDQVTLVPDSDDQLTSDHGFDLKNDGQRIAPVIEQLHLWGLRVSLFMDPDPEQIALARQLGADRVELYTGPYADAFQRQSDQFEQIHNQYLSAAEAATKVGIGINAGHDLNLSNLPRFLEIPGVLEVSIGHAFIADALLMGMHSCTKAYLEVIST